MCLNIKEVIMPLFDLAYSDNLDFAFSDGRLFISQFDASEMDISYFSGYDQAGIREEKWALIARSDNLEGYELDVNLLLMTFRIMSNDISPCIIFRISPDDPSLYAKLNEILCQIRTEGHRFEQYSQQNLRSIDESYSKLREAESISTRINNAVYFLYLAFHTVHWIQSFMFYMNTLEALFSNDEPRGATRAITQRIPHFLDSSEICTVDDMCSLYDVRSRITHGNIVANEDPKENLKVLKKLERTVIYTFRKLISENGFQNFRNSSDRARFMSSLD
jgi:hypothetical protein